MQMTIETIINEAKDESQTWKITINTLRALAERVGNAEVDRAWNERNVNSTKPFKFVVYVGLHGGKWFYTAKEAAEFLAGSILSLEQLKQGV